MSYMAFTLDLDKVCYWLTQSGER